MAGTVSINIYTMYQTLEISNCPIDFKKYKWNNRSHEDSSMFYQLYDLKKKKKDIQDDKLLPINKMWP